MFISLLFWRDDHSNCLLVTPGSVVDRQAVSTDSTRYPERVPCWSTDEGWQRRCADSWLLWSALCASSAVPSRYMRCLYIALAGTCVTKPSVPHMEVANGSRDTNAEVFCHCNGGFRDEKVHTVSSVCVWWSLHQQSTISFCNNSGFCSKSIVISAKNKLCCADRYACWDSKYCSRNLRLDFWYYQEKHHACTCFVALIPCLRCWSTTATIPWYCRRLWTKSSMQNVMPRRESCSVNLIPAGIQIMDMWPMRDFLCYQNGNVSGRNDMKPCCKRLGSSDDCASEQCTSCWSRTSEDISKFTERVIVVKVFHINWLDEKFAKLYWEAQAPALMMILSGGKLHVQKCEGQRQIWDS